ncbi:hypothetical protein [Sphingobium sp. ba1]|jgi:hypothetical protein|uniref:hypothetical protein n=1 Tax=Sphingobium sp. ba1 TaxID=1522072 RepID=UPI0012E0C221|nr:hypothetical protein [Sphingobium sp. ba1]
MPGHSNNIVQFPREVLAERKIRQCRAMLEKLHGYIEDGERNPTDLDTRMRAETAPGFIEMWMEDLQKALLEKEMLTADDAIRFKGLVYRAYPSQAGAN